MKNLIRGNTIITAAKEQVSCDLAGEAAILNLKNGVYYGLNTTGARIWNFIQEPKSADEIRDVIINEYDVESDRCERDLIALLEQMAAEGLIEVKTEGGAVESS